jgi:cytochrome o ubiquinol oxidase operon protein cyoD
MKATLSSYITGFVLSLALTLGAAWLVSASVSAAHSGRAMFSPDALIGILLALAVVQLFIQLICFMHLADESGPRWKLGALVSALGIILIVVVGSIWIMDHLNYNMMASPADMNAYIQSQDGF